MPALPGRRMLIGSVTALALPASLLMASAANSDDSEREQAASSATSTAVVGRKATRATITAQPQINQYGKRPASASAAKAGVSVKISPKKVGRKVTLQAQSGTSWTTVAKTKVNKKGLAEFAVAPTRNGAPAVYRAVAASFKGSAGVTTDPVTVADWLQAPSFSDEFSGRSLASAWSYRGNDYEPQSMRKCSKGSSKAVKVGGGTVRLSVMKDKARKGKKCVGKRNGNVRGKFDYRLNGHIGTEGAASIKYGFAAARIKFQKNRGQHASFWMQPDRVLDPHGDGAEIDVIEYFGEPHPNGGLTSFTYHKRGNKSVKTGSWIKDSKSFLANKSDRWYKRYHVFSVEWTPSEYIFRIDGKESWRSRAGISETPQFAILSLLSSDYELENLGGDKKLPQHMYVDWIRMWQAPTS